MTTFSASVLRTPLIEDESIHHRVVRAAGVVYGAMAAVVFALSFWGLNALAVKDFSPIGWLLLAMGLLICVPIGLFVGWLAARTRWSALSIFLWIVGCMAFAWIGGHLPYEGLSLLARLGDPYPAAREMYPFTISAGGFTGISMLVGAGAGLFVGMLSLFATERAWEASTAKHRLGVKSILLLLTSAPPLIVFGLLADYQINSSLRDSLLEVDHVIQVATDPATDLIQARLPYMQSFRSQLSTQRTLLWNSNSPELISFVIDAQFDTGLLIRCPFSFGAVFLCNNLGRDTHAWMTQLMTTGHTTCVGCSVQVERETRRWLAQVLPSMGTLREVTLLKHLGGWLYQRALFDSGRMIDCRFSGDRPITVDLCIEAKN